MCMKPALPDAYIVVSPDKLRNMRGRNIGHELRLVILSAIAEGECAGDIGGSLGTREFTRVIAERLKDRF